MYHLDVCYSNYHKEGLFETYEEALASAQEAASDDYDDNYFYVTEVKALVKADRPKSPVTVTQATDIVFTKVGNLSSNWIDFHSKNPSGLGE